MLIFAKLIYSIEFEFIFLIQVHYNVIIMKTFFTIFFSCFSIFVFGQYKYSNQTYKNCKIEWNDSLKKSYLVDTVANTRNIIDEKRNMYDFEFRHIFQHGFILSKEGDMKSLKDLNCKVLLAPSHFIRFYEKDSLIKAFICSEAKWIFLNFKGDTLSFGRGLGKDYAPNLGKGLNPAQTVLLEQEEIGGYIWGYLDDKAKWAILPQFHEVREFENGLAKVQISGKWGVINSKGNFLLAPSLANDNFTAKIGADGKVLIFTSN